MWDKSIFKMEQSFNIDYCLVVEGVWVIHNFWSVMCNIYAPNVAGERKNLWEAIMVVRKNIQGNWCLTGDFNTVRVVSERKGCRNEGNRSAEFNDFISVSEFFYFPICGKVYSWYGPENKRSMIDRFLISCG
ncbi:hypothetical protein CRYUN_Cryun41cG0003500 [Craigia yunnanensis]